MALYLITGSAGFIGSKVAEMLLDQGHEVVGLDNLNDAYDPRLKEWRLAQLDGKRGLTFHHLDICNREVLRQVFNSRIDAVINLAARSGVRQSLEDPWVYYETNVNGTLNLLELCREFGITKFVLASSSSLYGANDSLPCRESADSDAPLSPYAASKKAAEVLCYSYHYLYGIDITVPRFFTVYGPAGRPEMSLFRFVQWIAKGNPVMVYGDGQQSRDFTYVDDIARGVVACLMPVGYEVVNLGSDQPVVLLDAISLIEKNLKKKALLNFQPRHAADVTASWADISKAKHLLGWAPETSLTEGIGNLVAWYRDNERWAKDIHT